MNQRQVHHVPRTAFALLLGISLAAPSRASGSEWSMDDLLFLLRARDVALADLALPFEVNYQSTPDCAYREVGWWFRSGERCGVYLIAGCRDKSPNASWTAWDGARSHDASWAVDWSSGAPDLVPPPEEDVVRMHVSKVPFAGRLSEPMLPAEFGLNLINNPWSEYLPSMGRPEIRGEVLVNGRACVEVCFDMDTNRTGEEYGFPWLVCFDKESLLAVRVQCFESWEAGVHEYTNLGLTGEPEFTVIGGGRWVATRLTEVVEQLEIAPGTYVATAGRLRQGPEWSGIDFEMKVDPTRIVLERERITPMLSVRARADAAVRDETMMPAGDVADSTATNVRESEGLAKLLAELGRPAPAQRIEPFSESFFEASALYLIRLMEHGEGSLESVLQSFLVQDRVRKLPSLARTQEAARNLGLHARLTDGYQPGHAIHEPWMLTALTDQAGSPIRGAVVARVEGDNVRVIGARWSTAMVSLETFRTSIDGSVLLISGQDVPGDEETSLRFLALVGGAACLLAATTITVHNASRRRVGTHFDQVETLS